MSIMEDSGIDSGDKINSICFESDMEERDDNIFIESDNSSNENVEVVFRNPCIDRYNNTKLINIENTGITKSKISDKVDGALSSKNEGVCLDNNGDENIFDSFMPSTDTNEFCSTTNAEINFLPKTENISNVKDVTISEKPNQINSCKILQRKLELKVERAKRNYSQLHEEKDTKPKSSGTLIPINRLQIPGCIENVPLVEYNSDNNSDDDVTSFFPIKNKAKKQDLSDTFSIQEMTIESDTDDSETQYLELLPPTPSQRAFEKLLICVCCENERHKSKCVIL